MDGPPARVRTEVLFGMLGLSLVGDIIALSRLFFRQVHWAFSKRTFTLASI